MFEELNKLVNYGKQKADFVEISLSDSRKTVFNIEKNELKAGTFADIKSVFVRVWIDGKQGISSSNVLGKEVVESAVSSAKNSKKKDFFYGLPKRQIYPQVKGMFDKEVENEERMAEILRVLLEEFKGRKSYLPLASLASGLSGNFVVNSEGIEAYDKMSFMDLGVSCVAKDKNISSIYDSLSSRKIFSIDEVRRFAKAIADEAELFLKAKKLKEFKIPENVILEGYGLFELMENAFLPNFNAENVLKGKSIFKGKLGEKLFSEKFSLDDNGLLEGGLGSRKFDDEGSASKSKKIIENGVLNDFIYDYNSAVHMKKDTGGNACSDSIDFSNLVVGNGKETIESQIDEGLIIKLILGGHTSNPFTTNFSVNPILSYYLKIGEKTPIKDFLISGNLLDMLKKIVAVGNVPIHKGNFYSPPIAFKNLRVSVF